MSAYQQNWIEMLKNTNLQGWKIKAIDNDIYINTPADTDMKVLKNNIPGTIEVLSMDIDLPVSRLKFIFYNGMERFEYLLNPDNEIGVKSSIKPIWMSFVAMNKAIFSFT